MLNKFYMVTVRRPKLKLDGTRSLKTIATARRYCRGDEEVRGFVNLALENAATLTDIKITPISEAEFAKHRNPGY